MKEFYLFGHFIPHGFGVEKIDNQTVYEGEWWHFDYDSWSEYGIQNEVFSQIGTN